MGDLIEMKAFIGEIKNWDCSSLYKLEAVERHLDRLMDEYDRGMEAQHGNI